LESKRISFGKDKIRREEKKSDSKIEINKELEFKKLFNQLQKTQNTSSVNIFIKLFIIISLYLISYLKEMN
jgi:hypothetical protein